MTFYNILARVGNLGCAIHQAVFITQAATCDQQEKQGVQNPESGENNSCPFFFVSMIVALRSKFEC